MDRLLNFSAGPSAIALEVLQEAQRDLVSYKGSGVSIMEVSHRGKVFEALHNETIALVREFYALGDEYAVLFLQGGGTLQFSQTVANLYNGGVAEYANTGVWTQKAIKEAKIAGIKFDVVASSEADKFAYIPKFEFSDTADYGYICSNNTIYGTQYATLPTPKCPLVVDSSSDLFSREVDFKRHNIGCFFGGAQKNAGPAGVTIVIVRRDLLDRVGDNVPMILRYKTQVEANSLSNTPPTFGIYMLNLVLKWLKKLGGLKAVDEQNREKANLLYDYIDASGGFYTAHAQKGSRSLMNVSFVSKSSELDAAFVKEAEVAGMIGLKGHKLLGGLRASIYNAVSLSDVKKLVEFMERFKNSNL